MALSKIKRGSLSTGIDDNSDATAITIDSSENTGIGTTATLGAKLFVAQGAAASPSTSGNMTTGSVVGSSTAGEALNVGTDADGVWYNAAYANNAGVARIHRWLTGGTERLRTGSNGHLYATCNDGSLANLTLRNGASGDAPDFLQCRDSANNLEMKVEPDGDVYNANGTYGTLSDQKLKENITDASSQWDDIKALRLRKYNLIGNENFHIGVVAQELEAAGMSGLVSESVDFDEDGNDLGTTTKSVKYSILHTKALKALQEAMERIETLETEMTALKARVTALEDA